VHTEGLEHRTYTRWLGPAIWGALAIVAVTIPGLSVSLLDEAARPDGRVTPELEWVQAASGIALLVSFAVPLWRIARSWWLVRGRRAIAKVGFVAASLIAHAALAFVALVLMVFTNFHLFDDSYAGSSWTRHGRVYYLYEQSASCGWTWYAKQPGEWTVTRFASLPKCARPTEPPAP
jgi:hypothetical protein